MVLQFRGVVEGAWLQLLAGRPRVHQFVELVFSAVASAPPAFPAPGHGHGSPPPRLPRPSLPPPASSRCSSLPWQPSRLPPTALDAAHSDVDAVLSAAATTSSATAAHPVFTRACGASLIRSVRLRGLRCSWSCFSPPVLHLQSSSSCP
ncbi:Hypothetical predicted protein [Cloeon dipterum]|uniref:Uncharacterized protein n=1 Tax=Cloeon dipterum TaxID=197152 RepID=A0A8S1E711_9INSE|nr:Hypothetical predicted protein [Cloeon dipterum]